MGRQHRQPDGADLSGPVLYHVVRDAGALCRRARQGPKTAAAPTASPRCPRTVWTGQCWMHEPPASLLASGLHSAKSASSHRANRCRTSPRPGTSRRASLLRPSTPRRPRLRQAAHGATGARSFSPRAPADDFGWYEKQKLGHIWGPHSLRYSGKATLRRFSAALSEPELLTKGDEMDWDSTLGSTGQLRGDPKMYKPPKPCRRPRIASPLISTLAVFCPRRALPGVVLPSSPRSVSIYAARDQLLHVRHPPPPSGSPLGALQDGPDVTLRRSSLPASWGMLATTLLGRVQL